MFSLMIVVFCCILFLKLYIAKTNWKEDEWCHVSKGKRIYVKYAKSNVRKEGRDDAVLSAAI